jgi:hypothetical protein
MLPERKNDIELARDMLRNAINLAFDHLFNDNDVKNRINSFDSFVNELLRSYCAVHSVSKNLHKSLEAKYESPPPP